MLNFSIGLWPQDIEDGWYNLKEGQIVYLTVNQNIYKGRVIMGRTKMFQKVKIDYIDHDTVIMLIVDGEFAGEKVWFSPHQDSPLSFVHRY